jgi:hypothetical protein
MHGTYLFQQVPGGKTFEVIIPTFQMMVPFKQN